MKSLLSVAVITALLSTPLLAKQTPTLTLPEGVTCNDVFWTDNGRINPTELSDRQKCILSVHYGETNSGAMGNILWIRIDGEYFSVSKSVLKASFSNEEDAQRALQREYARQHGVWKSQQQGK